MTLTQPSPGGKVERPPIILGTQHAEIQRGLGPGLQLCGFLNQATWSEQNKFQHLETEKAAHFFDGVTINSHQLG